MNIVHVIHGWRETINNMDSVKETALMEIE